MTSDIRRAAEKSLRAGANCFSWERQKIKLPDRIETIDGEVEEIGKDQERLRDNIKALTATAEAKQLISRYVAKADTQETRLEQLNKERQAAIEERARLQRAGSVNSRSDN